MIFFLLSTVRTDISVEKGKEWSNVDFINYCIPFQAFMKSLLSLVNVHPLFASVLESTSHEKYNKEGKKIWFLKITAFAVQRKTQKKIQTSCINEMCVLWKHFSADIPGVGHNHRTFHTQVVLKGEIFDLESGWHLSVIIQKGVKQFAAPQTTSQGKHNEVQTKVPTGTGRTNKCSVLCH